MRTLDKTRSNMSTPAQQSTVLFIFLSVLPWILIPLAVSDILPPKAASILLLINVFTPLPAIYTSLKLARLYHKAFWVMMVLNILLALVMLVIGFMLFIMGASG